MKKVALLATALAIVTTGSAFAADMHVKALRAPPPPAFDPWDIAFGGAIMSNYVFRGITQSNNKPSVAAYFEPRYNVTKDLQLYIGVAGESISFPNRAAAEIDIYGGIRPTFGAFAFDIGVWGYLYPGGTCYYGGTGVDFAGNFQGANCAANALPNGNVMKKDVSFFEVYGKMTYTVNDNWAFGINEFYSPNFLNTGAWGNYASITGKWTAPSTTFGSSGVGMYVSGEFGRQWFGTSDSFYGTGPAAAGPGYVGPFFPNGIKYADYNTWNIGVGFTYKVMTLDLRYSDTDLSKADCNAFTSDYTSTFNGSYSSINPSGVGSKWCGATGIAKLSFDLTAMTNLK
ncbi:TorF family putative porin [Bradyrhizobium japonicum]|uniref:TorF family putative porin n=1 Tax=Bradyrhizobium japonicum TaxID=375 RepID=UPI00042420A2|nr:TorF family putative porin [Bradyrhizobium japonicum]